MAAGAPADAARLIMKRSCTRAGQRVLVVLIATVAVMGCEREEPQAAEVTGSNPIVPLDRGLVRIETADDTIRLNVEIAETSEQKSTGLMERRVLPDNEGMLFVYDEEQGPSDFLESPPRSGEYTPAAHIPRGAPDTSTLAPSCRVWDSSVGRVSPWHRSAGEAE